MPWNNIIGQKRVKEILQRAIAEKRVPHSYCFWGIDGIGKDALAIEFAKVVNCTNPQIIGSEAEACGNCASCRQASSLRHPNIQLVFSLPTPKISGRKEDSPFENMSDDQMAEIQGQIHLKAENPYHKITIPNANIIRISSIREIKRNLNLSANLQGRRVVIISRADEMNTEAANAFLKTLEEPHENITIIITTSRRDSIPTTILSRCQQLHCEPLADEDIVIALNERQNVPLEEARIVAVFAQGSYVNSLDFLDENMKAFREEVVSILRISLKRKNFRLELLKAIEPYIKEKDRKKNETFLTLMLIWLRDVLTFMATNEKKHIINIDQIDIIEKFASNFGNKDLSNSIKIIENAVNQLKKNVQPQLVFINLFIKLREVFF